MESYVEYVLVAVDRPVNLPSPDAIIEERIAYRRASIDGKEYRRVVGLFDGEGTAYAWMKFGRDIPMAEALTQDHISRTVNGTAAALAAGLRIPKVYLAFQDKYNRVFIVMEFIVGVVCTRADAPAVAKAVESLTSLQSPDGNWALLRRSYFPLLLHRPQIVSAPPVCTTAV